MSESLIVLLFFLTITNTPVSSIISSPYCIDGTDYDTVNIALSHSIEQQYSCTRLSIYKKNIIFLAPIASLMLSQYSQMYTVNGLKLFCFYLIILYSILLKNVY